MITPTHTGTRVFHASPARQDSRRAPFLDPWRELCEFCRLEDDCCRTEGDISPVPTNRSYPDCIIWLAAVAGKTPEEALEEEQCQTS